MSFCRSSGESASCTVMFVIIYYFTMAGVIWFAILAYTWDLTFRTFNSKRDVIEGRKGYFHLVAWSLPLVLTIVCLAVTGVSTLPRLLFILRDGRLFVVQFVLTVTKFAALASHAGFAVQWLAMVILGIFKSQDLDEDTEILYKPP